jgi:hypothetical protein
MGDRRGAYKVLTGGRPEGKVPSERLRHRWEDNTTMDLHEDGWWAWTKLIFLRTRTGGGLLQVW